MKIDVVNKNKKVGSVELSDEVFGGRVKTDLIHESVVRANAADRRGTHATKTRASSAAAARSRGARRAPAVPASAKPARRCGVKGGTVFGPQPRSYELLDPQEGREGRAARGADAEVAGRLPDHRRRADRESEVKTKAAVGVLKTIGVNGKALLVDARSTRSSRCRCATLPA